MYQLVFYDCPLHYPSLHLLGDTPTDFVRQSFYSYGVESRMEFEAVGRAGALLHAWFQGRVVFQTYDVIYHYFTSEAGTIV